MTLILGIETSCDETAAAVVESGRSVRSNVVASQDALHRKYGGVVPEIASRAHLERIDVVVVEALARAGVSVRDLSAVAVGNRPGLIGSLLVGVSAAKATAWAAGLPLVGVDHVEAHLYAPLLHAGGDAPAEVAWPALGLVVSGGHTSLYALRSPIEPALLGHTIDDAVGEAYDKAAVILDAGYPGGPSVDALARRGSPRIELPRSMLGAESLDFSYSGLKTALLYAVRGRPQGRGGRARFAREGRDLDPRARADMAAAFQEAAIDVLIRKLERALERQCAAGAPVHSVVIGGGVSANSLLRRRAVDMGRRRAIPVHLPPMAYCLDNAAMIAGLAHAHLAEGHVADLNLPAVATGGAGRREVIGDQ